MLKVKKNKFKSKNLLYPSYSLEIKNKNLFLWLLFLLLESLQLFFWKFTIIVH